MSHYTSILLPPEDHGTSHFSIIDKDRNAVGYTASVNFSFGSKVVSRQTGVVMNNQMDDFSVSVNASNGFGLPPSKSNTISKSLLLDDSIDIAVRAWKTTTEFDVTHHSASR